MREISAEIDRWQRQGKAVSVATIVKAVGSSLRPLGAKMAMTASGEIAGSVTGGCVEGAVYQEAQEVIASGRPKLLHYGASDDTSWEIGLSCGGSIDVLVEALQSPAWESVYAALQTSLEKNRPVAVATVIAGPGFGNKLLAWPDGGAVGSLGSTALDRQVLDWMLGPLRVDEPAWNSFTLAGETVEVFADILPAPARLIIVGAVHIAIPLAALAKTMGFRTLLIDPRAAFATPERFPQVDELIVEWPTTAMEKLRLDGNTFVAVLSHDEKLDNPALQVALASPARYVGALGSPQTHAHRVTELRKMGVPDEQIARIHAPIGIKVGAKTPEENCHLYSGRDGRCPARAGGTSRHPGDGLNSPRRDQAE